MFVQINLLEHDLVETPSSLNFASRVPDHVMLQLDKARQETKFKRCIDKLRKVKGSLQIMENKARSKDQTYKYQQEKIKELEEQLELKVASHSQSEKQFLPLEERLKGREEPSSSRQHKISELEKQTWRAATVQFCRSSVPDEAVNKCQLQSQAYKPNSLQEN